jgi:hypothetical protein
MMMDPIIVDSIEETEKMQALLGGLINQSGFVSQGELLMMLNRPYTSTDYTLGWTTIDDIVIEAVEGGYSFQMPEPASII